MLGRFGLDNLTSRHPATRPFPFILTARLYRPRRALEDHARMAWIAWRAARRLIGDRRTLYATFGFSTTSRVSRHQLWDDTVTSGFGDPKVYVVQTQRQGRRALPADDHRPRRPRPRPDLRLRHDRIRRRAMGSALDHHRHESGRARPRPDEADGAKYPYYLLADSPEGQRKEAELTGAPPLGCDRGRHPQGLRLRAGPARDPEVDRPEPRDP